MRNLRIEWLLTFPEHMTVAPHVRNALIRLRGAALVIIQSSYSTIKSQSLTRRRRLAVLSLRYPLRHGQRYFVSGTLGEGMAQGRFGASTET